MKFTLYCSLFFFFLVSNTALADSSIRAHWYGSTQLQKTLIIHIQDYQFNSNNPLAEHIFEALFDGSDYAKNKHSVKTDHMNISCERVYNHDKWTTSCDLSFSVNVVNIPNATGGMFAVGLDEKEAHLFFNQYTSRGIIIKERIFQGMYGPEHFQFQMDSTKNLVHILAFFQGLGK